MKHLVESVSRILEVKGATDMEVAMFVLRQLDTASPLPDDPTSLETLHLARIIRDLLEELENPFARRLLADELRKLTRCGREGGTLEADPTPSLGTPR